MQGGSDASSVLESLIIELIGDDSKLQAVFDSAVASARAAAGRISEAFTEGLSGVDQVAVQAARAWTDQRGVIDATTKVLEGMVAQLETAFIQTVRSGEKSKEAFENYRREVLAVLDASEANARIAGVTTDAYERLRRTVRETEYAQKQQTETSRDQAKENRDLDDVIKSLSARIATQRNLWAGRITSDEEFERSTRELKQELLDLARTTELNDVQMRRLTQSVAYAQRGLDSAAGVASRGGLAWTAQIAIANQLGQSLRNLGPAGGAAASALGIVGGALGSLQAPLKMSDLSITKIIASFTRLTFIVAPLAAAVGAIAGASGLGALTLSAAKAAQELENATHRTGLTIEGLQELQHAARVTGVPLDLLSTTMQRLQRRAADANAGNKGLQEAFRALGVTLTDSEGRMRSTEDLLGQVADGLNRVENNADRLALAFKVFDTEGGRLLPLLKEGSEGIRQLREEARELGLVVSGDTVMSLVEFQAEVETVKRQFEVLRIEVGAAFLPIMRDVLVPLLQEQVIPWLQNAATAIDNFSDAFFDTSEAGAAFRADTLKNLQAVIMLGRGVVAAAAAVVGGVQTILGVGAGVFEAGVGLREWIDSGDEIVAQRERLIAAIQQQEETLARLRAGDLPPGFDPARVGEAIEQTEAQLERYRQALVDFDAEFPQGAMGSIIMGFQRGSENLLGGAVNSFTAALDALEADIPAMIEAWAQGIAPRVGRAARTIGDGVGTGIGDGVGTGISDGVEKALPGSIAFAREKVQEFTRAFDNATSEEARRIADEQRQYWQGVLDAMLAPFQPAEATAAARLWTERLSAELRAGIKKPIEVFNLLTQGIATARERVDEVYLEFGWDSEEYRDALAGLQFLENWLRQFQSEHATVTLELEVVGGVADVQGALPDLTLPLQTTTPAQALANVYQHLIRVAEAQARLNGVSEDTRAIYQETIEVFELAMQGLDPLSDEWLTLANVLIMAKDGLEAVNEALAEPPSTRLRDFLAELAEAAETARAAILGAVEAIAGSDPVRAARSALETSQGVRRDENVARFLGEDFDRTASEVSHLEREVRELASRYDELGAFERARLAIASRRLQTLRQRQEEERAAAEATEAFTEALEQWNAAVAAIGASEDPLSTRAAQLEAWLDAGMITLEQFNEMLAELAAAQDRLAGGLDPQAFDAWATSVGRIGVTLDPVTSASAELGTLMAEGRITAEQYAIGLELVADAMDRIEAAEAAAEVRRITDAWEAAGAQLADMLGVDLFDVVDSQWDEMRKAAKAAFDAGIIGADELAKALRLIGILEVADGFKQIADTLSGAGQVIPTFVADITEAYAQLVAGDRTGAITSAFQAATAAVRSLGDAFEDETRRGEAMLDLLIGGASAIAGAIGGPALGQAVAAAGEFIKSILGDLSNGLAEIQRRVESAAASSRYLGEGIIQGIAESNTRRVSRGGLLGLLGFTKAQLDEEGFRAGLSIAEGIANGLVGTLTSGDFETAWKDMIDDILVQGVIEAFMATAAVQQAIMDAFEAIQAGDSAAGAAALERIKEDFRVVWEMIQEITGATDELAVNVSGALASGITSALDSSSVTEAWERTTLSMKNTLRDAIIQAWLEGEAMQAILDEFNQALNDALGDGVITEQEMRHLEALFGQTEGPLRELWDALEALGLGFDDLNEAVNAVTNSLTNVPSVFLDTQARFDSIARDMDSMTSTATFNPREFEMPILIQGDVYGFDDFEAKVGEAMSRAAARAGLASYGVTRADF